MVCRPGNYPGTQQSNILSESNKMKLKPEPSLPWHIFSDNPDVNVQLSIHGCRCRTWVELAAVLYNRDKRSTNVVRHSCPIAADVEVGAGRPVASEVHEMSVIARGIAWSVARPDESNPLEAGGARAETAEAQLAHARTTNTRMSSHKRSAFSAILCWT